MKVLEDSKEITNDKDRGNLSSNKLNNENGIKKIEDLLKERLEQLMNCYETQANIIVAISKKLDLLNAKVTSFVTCTNISNIKPRFEMETIHHEIKSSYHSKSKIESNYNTQCNLKIAYITGFPCMKIKLIKEKISLLCNIERSEIANVEFLPYQNLTEIILEGSVVPKFIRAIKNTIGVSVIPGTNIISNDKAGFLQRLSRVKLEQVKNNSLKLLYNQLEHLLSEKCTEIALKVFTVDDLIDRIN